MIRSMTGYGAAEGPVGDVRVGIELRTVNHRFFNPSIKLPLAFSRWEGEVREALRLRINRGHVSLLARITHQENGNDRVDEERFASYVMQLRELKDRYGLAGDVDLATVLRLPDVVGGRRDADEPSGNAGELISVVEAASAALMAMREAEGARLTAVLLERLATIEAALLRIAQRAPERVVAQRDRLRQSVREISEGIALDEQRLAQEVAVLADRLDVNEELDRFSSHISAFRETLRTPPVDGVGKRLGFLLQEMLREANTTGSKASDAAMLHEIVLVKEELERIREQVENLE